MFAYPKSGEKSEISTKFPLDSIHGDFMLSWRRLVSVDPAGVLTIKQAIEGEVLSVGDAGE